MDRLRRGLMVGAALGLIACNGEQPNAPAPASTAASSIQQDADTLARLFALAMQDPSVRVGVRDALRASPFVEHKVSLQDLLATAAGRALIAGAAERSGRSRRIPGRREHAAPGCGIRPHALVEDDEPIRARPGQQVAHLGEDEELPARRGERTRVV